MLKISSIQMFLQSVLSVTVSPGIEPGYSISSSPFKNNNVQFLLGVLLSCETLQIF
jgi:hypothetical protein